MRIDGKPNVAPNLTIEYVDASNPELVKDAAGAMVRATIKETFEPQPVHHRMTEEFTDFAVIVDSKNYEEGNKLAEESLAVMQIIDQV